MVGFVPDLTDFMHQLRCTIAPLRYGAGLKGKILESFAHGLPCVMSEVAAEGFRLPRRTGVADRQDPEGDGREAHCGAWGRGTKRAVEPVRAGVRERRIRARMPFSACWRSPLPSRTTRRANDYRSPSEDYIHESPPFVRRSCVGRSLARRRGLSEGGDYKYKRSYILYN